MNEHGTGRKKALRRNRIADYTKKTFDHKISETERFYLLIHIARILQKKLKEDK